MKNSKKARLQKGFMLIGVVIVSIVLLMFVLTIIRYGETDANMVVRSKVQANLQSALDAGLDRSINILNQGNNWGMAPLTFTGYASLSGSAFTEFPNVKYYVKVLDGSKDVTFSSRLLDDTAAVRLTNTGDISYDRTVLVRATDIITGVTATALGVIHKNDVVIPINFTGFTSTGAFNLNSKTGGGSFNGCNGVPPGASSGCSGTVQGNPVTGGNTSNCIPKSTPVASPTPGSAPTVVIPASLPSLGAFTMSNVTLSSGKYHYSSWSGSGNSTVNLNTCAGNVEIYIDGNISMSGTVAILSGCPPGAVSGGTPAKAIIYCNGTSVGFAGGGDYEVAIYAPNADVTWNGGGTGQFYGAISAKTITGPSSNNVNFYYDDCLSSTNAQDNYQKPPVITSRWKVIP